MLIFKEFKIKSHIRDYSVMFVDDFSEILIKDLSEKSFLLIDKKVLNLYKKRLQNILLQTKQYFVIEAIEPNKSLDYVKIVVKSLLKENVRRDNKIIAIGGGIIQDIAGFVASILFRGIEWIFYPTTLLAQADSCIGGKTSINVDHFKNQLGTFYPPSHIVLDANFLKTLTKKDIKSGLGEIIKVHLLDGEESLEYINSHYKQAFADPAVIKELIFRSLMIKKNMIEKDEFDKGYRKILNYGHTFGHAIESITNYRICHGQAVTIGMCMANYLSFKKGYLSAKSFKKMGAVLLENCPDFSLKNEQKDAFLLALSRDKKNIDGNLNAILTEGSGKMRLIKIPFNSDLKNIIENFKIGGV